MTIVKNDLFDYYGLSIYQDEDKFKFSLDSILLAEFVDIENKRAKIVDFCTGNAPVPLILTSKGYEDIIGIELQKYIYDLGIKSIEDNNLTDKLPGKTLQGNFTPGASFSLTLTFNPSTLSLVSLYIFPPDFSILVFSIKSLGL